MFAATMQRPPGDAHRLTREGLVLPKLLEAANVPQLDNLRAAVEQFGADSFDVREKAVLDAIEAAKKAGTPAFWILLQAARSGDPEIAYRAKLVLVSSGVAEKVVMKYQAQWDQFQELNDTVMRKGISSHDALMAAEKANQIAKSIGNAQLDTFDFLWENCPTVFSRPGVKKRDLELWLADGVNGRKGDPRGMSAAPAIVGLNALYALEINEGREPGREKAREIILGIMERYPAAFASEIAQYRKLIVLFRLGDEPSVRDRWQKLGLDVDQLKK